LPGLGDTFVAEDEVDNHQRILIALGWRVKITEFAEVHVVEHLAVVLTEPEALKEYILQSHEPDVVVEKLDEGHFRIENESGAKGVVRYELNILFVISEIDEIVPDSDANLDGARAQFFLNFRLGIAVFALTAHDNKSRGLNLILSVRALELDRVGLNTRANIHAVSRNFS
jgi:hypothetical protein